MGVMVLASDVSGRPQIVVAVSDALVKDGIRAGDFIKPIARIVGGGGGGRPQMAQAGGVDSSKIPDCPGGRARSNRGRLTRYLHSGGQTLNPSRSILVVDVKRN